MRSSKALAILFSALAAAGCARAPQANDPNVRGIGYVRLDDVIKLHPLYPQLSQIQDSIDALDLRSLGGGVRSGAQIAQQTRELNQELTQAKNRAAAILQRKQLDYARREQQAINAALGAAAGGTNGNAAVSQMQGTAQQQAQAVTSQANSDFQTYRNTVVAQDNAAVTQISRQLGARADQAYRQRSTQLQEQESQLALQLSQRDAPRRLQLRTMLSNLALDDATRKKYQDELASLDQQEAATVDAQRRRDQETLAAYRKQLAASTQSEILAEAGRIHAQTRAKIASRQNEVSQQVSSQMQGLQPVAIPSNLPQSTRARLAQIHQQFNSEFAADAQKTIAQYQATKADLDAQYTALQGASGVATGAAAKQLSDLQRQRDDLYKRMVDQIENDAKSEAAKRGLQVVFVNVTAAGGGIDLTGDVEKDIESLHQ